MKLEGVLVRLRAVEERDLEAILRYRSDPELRAQIMTRGEPETMDRHRAWFEGLTDRDDAHVFAIADVATDVVLGLAGLYRIERDHQRAEWGFYVGDTRARLNGSAVEAELLLLDHAFGSEGLARLWCRVLASNPQVASLHRRFGFEVEAHEQHGDVAVVRLGIDAERYHEVRPSIAQTLARLRERDP